MLILNYFVIPFEQVILSDHLIEVIKLLMLVEDISKQRIDAILHLVLLREQLDVFFPHQLLLVLQVDLGEVPWLPSEPLKVALTLFDFLALVVNWGVKGSLVSLVVCVEVRVEAGEDARLILLQVFPKEVGRAALLILQRRETQDTVELGRLSR